MLVLATDTTGKSLSIALVQDDRLLGEVRLNLGYNHAVTHAPQIQALLDTCQTDIRMIDLFACTRGPGSYTGTRIGLATLKAMAYAAGKPAVGISTLETLAWPHFGCVQTWVCTVLDARNGRVFGAVYDGWTHQMLIEPGNYSAQAIWTELQTIVQHIPTDLPSMIVTGDGSDVFLQQKPADWRGSAKRTDPLEDSPRASVVARLALLNYQAGDPGDPLALEADYLSPASAERQKRANDEASR